MKNNEVVKVKCLGENLYLYKNLGFSWSKMFKKYCVIGKLNDKVICKYLPTRKECISYIDKLHDQLYKENINNEK